MQLKDLTDFEDEIAAEFNAGKIRHPVHLESGNEEYLVREFKEIHDEDWVCGSWRTHLKCLLKGVPREALKKAIRSGESISLCFPEYRIVSSAIVGGILPIAVGIALGIKRSGGSEKVHCFVGDMTARGGIFHECSLYAANFGLPIRFIIENNKASVCTPTDEAWGTPKNPETVRYDYRSKWPHAGAGHRIQF